VEAMQRSPSLSRRRTPNHDIPAGQWETVRRQLNLNQLG